MRKREPDAGLEPAAVGLKVQRSTDWANQALTALWEHQVILTGLYAVIDVYKKYDNFLAETETLG